MWLQSSPLLVFTVVAFAENTVGSILLISFDRCLFQFEPFQVIIGGGEYSTSLAVF